MVMEEIAELSDRLIVMSQLSSQFLQEIFKVPGRKIDMVPHGVPDLPFLDPNFYKDRFGVKGKAVLLTFGLLSPNKGIENVIQALPQILANNVAYLLAGLTTSARALDKFPTPIVKSRSNASRRCFSSGAGLNQCATVHYAWPCWDRFPGEPLLATMDRGNSSFRI